MTRPRTAFVFPGLNGSGHAAEHTPLLRLPGFAARWRLVARALSTTPGFAAFDQALDTGAELPLSSTAWPWRALAVVAMQLAVAEALEERGERADWLCGYSIGDVARNCFAGVAPFAAVVAFAAALPPLPITDGVTAAVHSPNAAVAADLALRLTAHEVSCSRLSPRFLMLAGPRDAVAGALAACAQPGVRTQELARCALHAPLQQPVGDVLAAALGRARLAVPRRALFSTLHQRAITDVADLRREFADNVTAPCHFAVTVRRLHEQHGVERFIDLGPGRHAARFVRHHDAAFEALTATELLALTDARA